MTGLSRVVLEVGERSLLSSALGVGSGGSDSGSASSARSTSSTSGITSKASGASSGRDSRDTSSGERTTRAHHRKQIVHGRLHCSDIVMQRGHAAKGSLHTRHAGIELRSVALVAPTGHRAVARGSLRSTSLVLRSHDAHGIFSKGNAEENRSMAHPCQNSRLSFL
jgi:hypothetical protein